MAPRLYLRPDVHAALQGEDIVLLDIAADAYLCLPQGAAHFDGPSRDGALDPTSPEAAAGLVAAGLATANRPTQARWAPPPALPRLGPEVDPPWPSVDLVDAWRLLLCVADLALHYRGRPFAHILDYARRGRRRVAQGSARRDLMACVRRFHAAAVWLPAPGKCLVRSFLLLRFLHRSGHDAQWVIGVRTWSFEAHCWLQSGERALDDSPDRLAGYLPICAA